ncbi:RpiR family transcriptional regulator [Plantibacter sp. H53]|jgi:DNA-binding MurR/RpiR family transcriptional regulator|uniref:MurR/RpiR family transcriptional regulator n=1 Tax=Plantibacter sp. H53 TaxID=1827323 RepID=UPI0007D9DD99|nr:MurR/RpiR family transcriptional regulator [Plantibacter sp. H53]OAN32098.1 RpiR family transcriptional regulator [Plantibacter sp. H53]
MGADVHRTSRAVSTEVRARLDELRPSERRIAESLLADPGAFATRSVAEIAEEASTSTTTVVRFTRKIGYDRFKDFRHDLTEENLRERLALAGTNVQSPDIVAGDSLDDIVAKVAANESLSIADTAQALDTAALTRAVAAVAGARRVDIFGVGASSIVAVDLQRKLSRIGRVALEWPDPHAAWTAAAILDEQAVAVAISHSGATADTVDYLRLAARSGATTIAITNHAESTLATSADIVLQTSARETAFRSGALGSRIAQLMVVDCLFIGVAQVDSEASIGALQRTFDAVRERRSSE